MNEACIQGRHDNDLRTKDRSLENDAIPEEETLTTQERELTLHLSSRRVASFCCFAEAP